MPDWAITKGKKTEYRRLVSQLQDTAPISYLKGTVPPDFSPLVFFFKQLLLAPVDKPSNDFDFFANIRRFIRLFQCIACVIDTGEANVFIIVG